MLRAIQSLPTDLGPRDDAYRLAAQPASAPGRRTGSRCRTATAVTFAERSTSEPAGSRRARRRRARPGDRILVALPNAV